MYTMNKKSSSPPIRSRFEAAKTPEVAIRQAFLIEYLPETLRMLRQHRNLTQANLARLAKISPDYLSELERNLSQPSLELMGRLGSSLQVIFFK
jgi:DNA-binding XRE family transcriptional regulator